MTTATATVRRAPFAELLFVDGDLLLSAAPGAPLRQLPGAHSRDLVRLLEFCAHPREPVAVLAHLAAHGVPDDTAADLVAGAMHTGVLEPAGGGAPERSGDVARFRALRRARRYVDYADTAVFEHDRSAMLARLAESPPPPVQPAADGARTALPHPAVHGADDALTAVGHLMFYGFGRLRAATFLDVLDVQLKAVPSFGARHPFDAYLAVPDGQPIPPGTYCYLPDAHALCPLATEAPWPSRFTLEIRLVFERLQWRYRQSVAYESAVLDAGHLLATLRAVAADRSLRIDRSTAPPLIPDRPLVTESIARIELSHGSCHG